MGYQSNGISIKWDNNQEDRPRPQAEGLRQLNCESIRKIINVNCESMKKISILMDMAMMHIITIVNGKYKNYFLF